MRSVFSQPPRSAAAAAAVDVQHHQPPSALKDMSDEEVVDMVLRREIPAHNLEKTLGDCTRAVRIRREVTQEQLVSEGRDVEASARAPFADLPQGDFDYSRFYDQIEGANCEAVIGYLPLPVGVIGPLPLNGELFRVPLATTEGALVASANRGCRAIAQAGGCQAVITKNGMTRAPLVRLPSAARAAELKAWVAQPENAAALTAAFNSTTRFGKLQSINVHTAGRNAFVRFACHCGDAMGMNMVTKGCVAALDTLREAFPEVEVVSMSGNVCADKKAAAINWVEGRGRSVVCEASLPREVVQRVLKTTPEAMVHVNINKNLVGSAVAGALGGFNAHASNLVAAVFLATGNDPAQVVESSQCITLLELDERADGLGPDLHISVTMPSVEVGTVGGGTGLPAQAAALAMLGCQGANRNGPGTNADTLARVVAGTVMAGELSLLAALASDDLLKAHIDLNRKAPAAADSGNAAAGSVTGSAPAASLNQRRSAHLDSGARGLHTAPPQLVASGFGHPSTGGPLPLRPPSVSAAYPATGSPIYMYPGACVGARLEPASGVLASAGAAGAGDDLYGEGPIHWLP